MYVCIYGTIIIIILCVYAQECSTCLDTLCSLIWSDPSDPETWHQNKLKYYPSYTFYLNIKWNIIQHSMREKLKKIN